MTWFVTLIFAILLTFGVCLSEANNKPWKKKLPTVVVVGKVYCDTCFQEDFDKTGHFISGASVAVECRYGSSPKPIFRKEAKTNKRGQFRVNLPFSVSKHAKRIQGCSVKLVRSSEPYCAVASTAARSSIHLKSRRRGTHVFSAGFFTFKPLNQPQLCNQKPIALASPSLLDTTKNNNNDLSFPPPLKDATTPTDVPPLPSLPIPNIPLPALPNLPALPTMPRIPILPSLPPLISSKPQAINDQTEKVHTQDLNYFPPNPNNPLFPPPPALPSGQFPRLIPDVPFPQLPITLPTLPSLPPLPRLPSMPNLPPLITTTRKTAVKPRAKKHATKSASRPRVEERQTVSFPPNPFQMPPLVPNPLQPTSPALVPNPFQPNPPPLFPNPFQPSPPTPFLPFPTIPGLTASPPPPAFPFTIPPFPFPTPRGPGTPPA